MSDIFSLDPPKPMEPKHFLIVSDTYEEDGDNLEVEHSSECPIEKDLEFGDHYTCAVGFEVDNTGLSEHFKHRDEPCEGYESSFIERVPPGRHEIEVWSITYSATPDHGEEYDGGLRLKEIQA